MKKFLRLGSVYTSLVMLIALACGTPAFAATSSGSGNGYKISPVRTDVTINPGTTKTVTVYVQNVSPSPEDMQVLINDFQARNDESGAPALLLNGQNAPQHGLKQFVTIPTPTFSLAPGQQKGLEVKISIPANATAGGYFGAIRVAPANVIGNKNVNLAASVASLILVTVPGNLTEQLSIASFQAQSGNSAHTIFLNGKGLQAAVRFQNGGNVQEAPFGKIQLKKGSKVLATYEINSVTPRGNVLPDSIRKFTVSLDKVGGFGKYTLEGNFGYGNKGQLLSAKTTFYVVPVMAMVVIVLIVLVVLFLIFGLPRLVRNYNQRVLRRAGRR